MAKHPNLIEFVVSGDPEQAKAAVEEALTNKRHTPRTVTWQDAWNGEAQRASVHYSMLIKGQADDRVKLGVRLMTKEPGQTLVQIEKLEVGGAAKMVTTSAFKRYLNELSAKFQAEGVLVSSQAT